MEHIIMNTDLSYVVTDRGQVFTDFKGKHSVHVDGLTVAAGNFNKGYTVLGVLFEYDEDLKEYRFSWIYKNDSGQLDTWEFFICDTIPVASVELKDLAERLL